MRPSWDSIWMDFAHTISKRSYDPQFQVGTVIVSEDNCQVLAVGYNGIIKAAQMKESLKNPVHLVLFMQKLTL